MKYKHALLPAMAVAAALLVLAGCGSGGGGGGDEPVAGAGTSVDTGAAPAAQADSFVTQVQAVIADTSDTSEPRNPGSYQATTPENTEPAPLS